MPRVGKIAGLTLAGGLLIVAAAEMKARLPAPVAPLPAYRADSMSAELDRCRDIAQPDAACQAAWQELQRHFFDTHDGAVP